MGSERHIVGLGGGGDTAEQWGLLHDYVLGIVGKERPRLLFVPTAVADDASYTVWFYEQFAGRAERLALEDVSLAAAGPPRPRPLSGSICVSGGNTANMLAIWRVHGIDALMREAWENGIVLWGASAGMICWFEHGVTDSFGPELDAIECLGFLAGSACPHYDGEAQRRPRYRALVDGGLPEGLAAEDGVALHFEGDRPRRGGHVPAGRGRLPRHALRRRASRDTAALSAARSAASL